MNGSPTSIPPAYAAPNARALRRPHRRVGWRSTSLLNRSCVGQWFLSPAGRHRLSCAEVPRRRAPPVSGAWRRCSRYRRPGRERFISAKEAIETATLGGAKALGIDHFVGTLEVGKQADIAVVSLANIAQQPIHDIHAALVFASKARDIVMTMVAGEEIYRNDKGNKVDEEEIAAKMKEIGRKMRESQ